MQDPHSQNAPDQGHFKVRDADAGTPRPEHELDPSVALDAKIAGINQILDHVDGAAQGTDVLTREFSKRTLEMTLTGARAHVHEQGAALAARRLAALASKAAKATAELGSGVLEISDEADRMIVALAGEGAALDALCRVVSGEAGSYVAIGDAMTALERNGSRMASAALALNATCGAILAADDDTPDIG
jgi:hypothetical protein